MLKNLVWLMIVGTLGACAGGVEQTDACAQYIECIDARDEQQGISTNVERFAPGGACWGGVEGQELCNASCENGLEYLSTLDGAPQECSP